MAAHTTEIELRGAGGEPVDFRRTIASHGVADLPPNRIDEEAWTLELTLPLDGKAPRRPSSSPKGARVTPASEALAGRRVPTGLRSAVAHVLRLDEDLSPFYEAASADPELAWVTTGAGRMIRSPTVFEEVVKTICTTNCTWSATVRMVSRARRAPRRAGPAADGPYGRPSRPLRPWRARSASTRTSSRGLPRPVPPSRWRVRSRPGKLDLEALGCDGRDELPDDELAAQLLALPGVGPYAAAHIMMLLGRYTPLILDSWTRPKYLKVSGRQAGEGHDDRAPLPQLRAIRRARVLAVPDSGLG